MRYNNGTGSRITSGMTTLGDDIKGWVKQHRWYEITVQTNQAKLDQQFGSVIETLAGQLDYHGQPKLRRGLLDCWDHLMAKCLKIDAICRVGCRNEVERLELEFLRSKAIGAAHELAEVIELLPGMQEGSQRCLTGTGVQKEIRELNPQERDAVSDLAKTEYWITYAEAAELLAVDKSTVSRWVKRGMLESNGQTGRRRRVDKTSVLLKKQSIADEYARQDERDIRLDRRRYG